MSKIKNVYLAGGMMSKGEQMQRESEKNDIKALGIPVYNPQDNKEINDKSNLDNNEGLAEKIVKADTNAIRNSDVVVIEPQSYAFGTMVEMGQIKGMKDVAQEILHEFHKQYASGTDNFVVLENIRKIVTEILNQQVFPHYQDIRRFEGVTETEDRRSFGVNQYVYGVALQLSNGKGFYEWDEILEELSKVQGGE